MKRLTYILALLLGSLGVMAQTNQPLPAGSKPLSNILYLAPDSTVWTGDEFNGGLFVDLAKSRAVDSAILTRQKAFALNVQDFGAVGDSSTINTQAFYNAFNHATANGFRYIYVPTGTYLVDSLITVPPGIDMFGDGVNSFIKPTGDYDDFITPMPLAAGGVPFVATVFNIGSESFVANIPGALSKGVNFIKSTTAASSFSQGDVLKLVDTAAYSFSGYREYYTEGEYFTVWKVSADTVFLDHPTSGSYGNTATGLIYKSNLSNSGLQNLRIQGPGVGFSSAVKYVMNGNSEFTNLYLTGGGSSNIAIYDSYNVALDRIISYQTDPADPAHGATQYGMELSGVQSFYVTRCQLFGLRHAFTTNSNTGFRRVVSRFGYVTNNTLLTTGDTGSSHAADLHGQSDAIHFSGNTMMGAQLRGKSHVMTDNTILPMAPADVTRSTIIVAEVKKMDFTISNNKIYTNDVFMTVNPTTSFTGGQPSYQPDKGGVFKLDGNVIESLSTDSATVTNMPFRITYSRPLTAPLNCEIEITNNTVVTNNQAPQEFAIDGYSVAVKMGKVRVANNRLKGIRIQARHQYCINVMNNSFSDLARNAVYTLRVDTVNIMGNSVTNFARLDDAPVGHSSRSAVFLDYANKGYIAGNTASGVNYAAWSMAVQNSSNLVIGANWFDGLSPSYTSSSNITSDVLRQLRIDGLNTTPASATATGTAGEIRFGTDGRIYICTGTNTWIRTPAATTW